MSTVNSTTCFFILKTAHYGILLFCQHFAFTSKRGICKGRQILVFEDAEENEDSRSLSLNLYHNGTVMIQGSEPALQTFVMDFSQIKNQTQLDTNFKQDRTEIKSNTSPTQDTQKKTTAATPLVQSPMSRMKEKFSLLEIEMVELKELILSHLKDNNDLQQLKQETESLQKNKEQLSKELQETREELKELKTTFRRQITEIKTEMQEELSALKSELQKKDELIDNMKNQLLHSSSSRDSQTEPLICEETLTEIQSLQTVDELQPPTDPQSINTTSHAQALILIDSNGKYLKEKLLFPKLKAQKIWCPNTNKALQILSDKNLNESYKHIIIHTGTNDLRATRGNVAPLLREVAIRASQRFPEAKITLSTLLPRSDVPFHVIHGNNVELSRACALIPNVHLAYHKDIGPQHMYDYVHLNKTGVQAFARVLKGSALGSSGHNRPSQKQSSPYPQRHLHPPTHNRQNPAVPAQQQQNYTQRHLHPPTYNRQDSTPTAPSQQQSYAAAVRQTPDPAAAELSQIKHLLNIICSKLVKQE